MGLLFKNRDKHHNTLQAKFISRGGGFENENMCDNGGSQPSGGGFGGTTRSNSAFGFGSVPNSGGGFGNTNQYRYGENETVNQGGYDCDLSHVHRNIFKMMEPH